MCDFFRCVLGTSHEIVFATGRDMDGQCTSSNKPLIITLMDITNASSLANYFHNKIALNHF